MSKAAPSKIPDTDLSSFCKSAFTLTFVIEVIGIDVWHDCNEGWVELGPIAQGVKIQYHLYPGQTFDVDVVIWPHIAQVIYGGNHDWVRTWQFLERRWLTFSIRHLFPVRAFDLRNFVATVYPSGGIGALSASSKIDKVPEVYLPPLVFGQRRQFAPVIHSKVPLLTYIVNMIWDCVVGHIPPSYLDGVFNIPYPVSDIRHQDAALYHVQNVLLNPQEREEIKEVVIEQNHKAKRPNKTEPQKAKFEIKLSGDSIISGAGRIVAFETVGSRPAELGELIVLISSANMPAQDDFPVFFVNVGTLTDIPLEIFKKNRFTDIYTRWTISEEEHSSEHQSLNTYKPKTEFDFNDHHAVPLPNVLATYTMGMFIDEPFRIELRGIRAPPTPEKPKIFGYAKGDRDFGIAVPPPLPNEDTDVLIAETKIDAKSLSKVNGFIRGEFPLYPPEIFVAELEREGICTNDINAIRAKIKPVLVIQPGDILEAQMSLEVSLGLVGCKPKHVVQIFSRLYCLISHSEAIIAIIRQIAEINESLLLLEKRQGLLTGFALDTGDTVMLYVEGPKEGHILSIWEQTEDYFPDVKPVFSSSAKYSCRLYPEFLQAALPFNILKMFVPLSVLLGLTPIYARPALPIPTRTALLKLGRLLASKFSTAPCCREMPTVKELKSFRLELCVAPRPPPITVSDIPSAKLSPCEQQSASRINWEKKAK